MMMSTKLPEVDLIDITFDEVEDSFGNSFCNSRLALDREVNLLDKEVCPAPVVQKASTEIYYVHQVRCLLSLPLLNNVLSQPAPLLQTPRTRALLCQQLRGIQVTKPLHWWLFLAPLYLPHPVFQPNPILSSPIPLSYSTTVLHPSNVFICVNGVPNDCEQQAETSDWKWWGGGEREKIHQHPGHTLLCSTKEVPQPAADSSKERGVLPQQQGGHEAESSQRLLQNLRRRGGGGRLPLTMPCCHQTEQTEDTT